MIFSNSSSRLRRPWAEMVGMPSRLTAEPAERASRSRALVAAQAQHCLSGYRGIRIDSTGQPYGQAARFSRWWLL